MIESVTLTEAAADKFREALDSTDTGLTNIRVVLQGVSCSGPQFQLGFDERNEGDQEIDLGGGKAVLVGPEALEALAGTTIDFVTNTLGVSGFKFTNSQHGAGCSSCPAKGCGSRSEDE